MSWNEMQCVRPSQQQFTQFEDSSNIRTTARTRNMNAKFQLVVSLTEDEVICGKWRSAS